MREVCKICVLCCSSMLVTCGNVEPKDCVASHETMKTVDIVLVHCYDKDAKGIDQCKTTVDLYKTKSDGTSSAAKELETCPGRKYKLLMKPKETDSDGKVTKYNVLAGAYYRKCMNYKLDEGQEAKCEQDSEWSVPAKDKESGELNGACDSQDTDDLLNQKFGDTDLDPGEAFTIVRAMARETGYKEPPKSTGYKNWIEFLNKRSIVREVVADESVKRSQMTYIVAVEEWLLDLLLSQKDIYLWDCKESHDVKLNDNGHLVKIVSKYIWGEGEDSCPTSKAIMCESPEGSPMVMIILVIGVLACLVGAFVFYAFFHHSWRSHGGSVRKTHGGTATKNNEVEMASSMLQKSDWK